jgi:hypothetical protein
VVRVVNRVVVVVTVVPVTLRLVDVTVTRELVSMNSVSVVCVVIVMVVVPVRTNVLDSRLLKMVVVVVVDVCVRVWVVVCVVEAVDTLRSNSVLVVVDCVVKGRVTRSTTVEENVVVVVDTAMVLEHIMPCRDSVQLMGATRMPKVLAQQPIEAKVPATQKDVTT